MSLDLNLVRLLTCFKLGFITPTLPERLTLARAKSLDHAAFLTLLVADEMQRRDGLSLERKLAAARFEERASLASFDWTAPVQVDRHHLDELFSLRFLANREHVIFVGRSASAGPSWISPWVWPPTAPATACSSAPTCYCARSTRRLNQQQSEDRYALIIERQPLVVTSNREVSEWVAPFADWPAMAAAGPSYRTGGVNVAVRQVLLFAPRVAQRPWRLKKAPCDVMRLSTGKSPDGFPV